MARFEVSRRQAITTASLGVVVLLSTCVPLVESTKARAAGDEDVLQLRAFKRAAEDRDGCRESAVRALRAFVGDGGDERAALLELLARSPEVEKRALGRFALAAHEARARQIYSRLTEDLDPGVRLQARLALEGIPTPVARGSAVSKADTAALIALAEGSDGFGDTDCFYARDVDLDGDGNHELVLTRDFHGAYGQHETAYVFGSRECPPVASVTVYDGVLTWIDYEHHLVLLASDIYCEAHGGRATAWTGVVAVRHRLFRWNGHGFTQLDTFFTPFRHRYP